MITIFEIRRFTTSFGSVAAKRPSLKLIPQKSKQIRKMYLSSVRRYVDDKVDSKLGYKK